MREIKKGEWTRERNGVIYQITDNFDINGTTYMDITKVANTPQELIEVGDLVEIECWISYEKRIRSLSSQFDYDNFRQWENVNQCATKILTPNSNGGYDLQWSADNDK